MAAEHGAISRLPGARRRTSVRRTARGRSGPMPGRPSATRTGRRGVRLRGGPRRTGSLRTRLVSWQEDTRTVALHPGMIPASPTEAASWADAASEGMSSRRSLPQRRAGVAPVGSSLSGPHAGSQDQNAGGRRGMMPCSITVLRMRRRRSPSGLATGHPAVLHCGPVTSAGTVR